MVVSILKDVFAAEPTRRKAIAFQRLWIRLLELYDDLSQQDDYDEHKKS
jgi:hypothetical protein